MTSADGLQDNWYIARYFCLPHLLIPLPFLLVGPALVRGGLEKWAALGVGALVMAAVVFFVLRRLPDLFQASQREKYVSNTSRLGAVLLLVFPVLFAVLAADSHNRRTTPLPFEALSSASQGEYFRVALPAARELSHPILLDERFGSRRGGTTQTLYIGTEVGTLHGRRLMLIERSRSEHGAFGEDLDLRRAQVRTRVLAHRAARLESDVGRDLLVKVTSWQALELSGGTASDLVLEWGVESPESQADAYTLTAFAFFLFGYVLCYVLYPLLFAGDDRDAVAQFRQLPPGVRRLFGFVRSG